MDSTNGMHTALNPSRTERPQAALPREFERLLALAHDMEQPERAFAFTGRLRGKNFALLSDTPSSVDALLFTRAATGLGANVAHIRPKLSELSGPREVDETARMMGRLYDGVACQGLPAALVRQIGLAAGVPVYDGLASRRPAIAALASRLTLTASPLERRRLLVQAWLVTSVG
jgi:ornithine carbamoyltransferase